MPLVRQLLRAPLFTATVVLTFAISTAVVAVTFALVWHILVRQLPYPDAARLVFVWNRYGAEKPESSALSAPDFDDRRKARSFEASAIWESSGVNLTDGEPERLNAARVTGDFFRTLGVSAALGQTFTRTEDRVVVLSDALWRRRFGARRDIVGSTVQLNGRPWVVAGVMSPRFAFPKRDVDLWLPLHLTAEHFADANRGNEYYAMIARLKRGVSLEEARAEMGVIDRAVIGRVPDRRKWLEDSRWHVDVFSVRDDLVRRNRTSLLVLFGAALLVLLLAAANVTGLFVARTTSRQREVAVRAALGAGRWRIARELSAEVIALAVAGAAIALLIARAAIPWAAQSGLPRAEEITVGPAVIAMALGSAILTALAIGLAISTWAWRNATAGDRGGTASRQTARVRSVLVAAQVAIAVTLVISGALLVETWRRLKTVELGFDPRGLVTARVELPRAKYETPTSRRAFFTELQARLGALPTVAAASATSDLPLSETDWTATFDVAGRDPALQMPSAHFRVIQNGYTEAMRIPTLRGRAFTAADRDGTAPVVLIDDVAARLYWPGQDPVGRTLSFNDKPRRIIGVVGAVRHGTPGEDAQPHVYFAMLQSSERSMYVVVRASGDPDRVGADLRAIVRSMDSAQPVFAVQTMEEYLERAVEQPRMRAALVGVFAAVGLLLAVLGLYGLLVFTVAARTREVGIRMALGARASQIVAFVGRWSFAVTAAGVGIGLAGAALMTQTMQAMLFGVDDLRGRVYVAVAFLFALVAAIATIIPAARAARIDPAIALRHD